MQLRKLSDRDDVPSALRDEFVDFLFTHLERYGDTRRAIAAAVEHSLATPPTGGGFLVTAREDDGSLLAVVVVVETGMRVFHPRHLLVYIATHGAARGRGIGRAVLQRVQQEVPEGVCLHVEPDNPARRLYERVGFDQKYLEMRYPPGAGGSRAED
jgi:ribosomal protein S18 acetylase RimI-like enzyme